MSGPSQSLVASKTTRTSGSSDETQVAIASVSFGICVEVAAGRLWRSRTARERSQPMTVRGMVEVLSMSCGIGCPKQLFRVQSDAEGTHAP